MANNSNLHYSKREQEDEFYTELSTIEKELPFYEKHFKDKVIYCNCDDPSFSQFWKYFYTNYGNLGLKGLYATYLSSKPYMYFYNGGKVIKTPISNGSYDSEECIHILEQADIVVSNPPYSTFKNYMDMLINNGKKFIILGNLNSVTYTNIMPLITAKKLWLGVNAGHYWFKVPEWYEEKRTDFKIDETGQKWRRMGNICWYTNLDVSERHTEIPLNAEYNESIPKCTNLDAIFIRYVADIPSNYDGDMAVPITILPKLSPDQFELRGFDKELTDNKGRVKLLIDGQEKTQYARVIIRRKADVGNAQESI